MSARRSMNRGSYILDYHVSYAPIEPLHIYASGVNGNRITGVRLDGFRPSPHPAAQYGHGR